MTEPAKEGKTVREILYQAKTGTQSVSDVFSKQKKALADQLESSMMERWLEEERIKLRQLRETQGTPVQTNQAQPFLQALLHGRSAQEITSILDALQPEHIDKILMMNNPSFSDFKNLARQPGNDPKTILEAVKTGLDAGKTQSNSGSDAKTIVEAMKVGFEFGRGQNPSQPQTNIYETLVKSTLEELKATREQQTMQERMRLEKEIAEIKNRPSAMEEISRDAEKFSTYRKVFGGTDQGTTNEFALKKEEMQQTERIETKKLDFEMTKWQEEKEGNKESTKQIYTLIGKALDGPISDITKGMGGAVAKKIEGQGQGIPLATIQCPNCKSVFKANSQLPSITCPFCGEVLMKAPPANQEIPQQPIQQSGTEATQQSGQQPKPEEPSQQ